MRRVLVIGCSGAGKSTFSRHLAAATGLPLISLDAEFWQPGWQVTPRDVWRRRVAELTAGPAWIQDGTFDNSLDLRLPRADSVIWFELPRWRCLSRVLSRILKSYGWVRPEMAPGCPEWIDPAFLHYVWTFNASSRPVIEAMIAAHGRHLCPVRFRRDADAAAFLDKVAASAARTVR